ncbi:hypothetical protein U1Q18_007192 [Sarracenia purpurea var. burkii]
MASSQQVQPPRMQQPTRGDRRFFSASDDSGMTKQIQATHSPDGREVDVQPILRVIKDVLHRVVPAPAPSVVGVTGQAQGPAAALMDNNSSAADMDGILETLAHTINRISSELTYKCSGGVDAHTTTMAILNMLSSYSWEAKVVISLAAFTVYYGDFWLLLLLRDTDPLAKSVCSLKQLPHIKDVGAGSARFEAISKLIKAILDLTNCIVEFKRLPLQYISSDTPELSTALSLIPTAAYWTIRSMVVCVSQIATLLGVSPEYLASTTETWELSSLTHKIGSTHDHLQNQLGICYQHIEDKRQEEAFQKLVRLFREPYHRDNTEVLNPLINPKNDPWPLRVMDGSNENIKAAIEVLTGKTVLLLISDLDILIEQRKVLADIYKKHHRARASGDRLYEIVWLPVVDGLQVVPLEEDPEKQRKFEEVRSTMPWYTVAKPSLLEAASIRYMKQEWRFSKKLILVVVDPHGKVVCLNALHMVMIWRNQAFPFTAAKEESLWKEERWSLELLVDEIDPRIQIWIAEGKHICLYGGEDRDWIREFTKRIKFVAVELGISIEMVYVGKSKVSWGRLTRIFETINAEQLSKCWEDPISVWYFWNRLESMWLSKTNSNRSSNHATEKDSILTEVFTVLSYDGSDQGWAIISLGSALMARDAGDTLTKSFEEFEKWKNDAEKKGLVPTLNEEFGRHHDTDHHCNRLILPGTDSEIPERVVCSECGRPMEKYLMYRCCND